mmetsp:Transcript_33454/g.56628  ORF Transcript_33454/g.56628 Transcript_33454/m.56628 type:complete len:84 (+) Transcript_33454:184-435(+)
MSNQPTMEKQKIIFSLGPLKITRCKDDRGNKITEEDDSEPMLLKYLTCSGSDLFCLGSSESSATPGEVKVDAEKGWGLETGNW